MKKTVLVRLKGEVLDPQGRAVQGALKALGVPGVRDVRVGKLIEIELDELSGGKAAFDAALDKACDELLANPVIEDYEILGT